MRLPWGPKARARRQAEADQRQQDAERARARARIIRLAGNCPSGHLPPLTLPHAERTNRRS